MKKPTRVPIHALTEGFRIRLAGGVIMTVTGPPKKLRDGRFLIPNDYNGEIHGDAHLTFPNLDANTAPPQEKPAEPQ